MDKFCRHGTALKTLHQTVGALLMFCGVGGAFAGDADPNIAKSIATKGTAQGVVACVACHGATGEGNSAAGFPRLAGLGQSYLLEQLNAFTAGARQNAVMQPIAKALTDAQRRALAAYYSALPSTIKVAGVLPDARPADTVAWLATRGRWADGLLACVQCHGPAGSGVGDSFPPLAGQPAAYIAAQLQGWKHGLRPPGPMSLMMLIANKLSDAEISALADYYAGLPAANTLPHKAERAKK